MKNEIGIIGNGTHSKRIQNILKLKKRKFFVTDSKNIKLKNEINKLYESKAIFIISPNNTHFKYLQMFKNTNYIFCEKPPVSSKKHLKIIEKYNYKKIYFNFNKRFSVVAEILKFIMKKFKIGELVYANMISSKGLAIKMEYKNNWRSNIKKSKKGVFETVSIHDIDLINYYFDVKKIYKSNLKNLSKIGNSFDTALTKIKLKNESFINIFSTYYSSLSRKSIFLFKNGILEFDIDKVTLRYPTKTYNKKMQFITPKIRFKKNINFEKDYLESLKKSVNYFLNTVDKNKNFKKKDFYSSIKSNNLIL
jgi:predicted dehydrogenase